MVTFPLNLEDSNWCSNYNSPSAIAIYGRSIRVIESVGSDNTGVSAMQQKKATIAVMTCELCCQR